MSRHRLRNKGSKSGMDSARRMLESLDKRNRNKRLLGARLANLQKMAVRFTSSFGPDLDAIEAFKKGEDYQGYVGKGKNKRLKFEVKGNKLFLLGHNIATKTKDGIKVSNAGFDTGLTYSTLKELGINAKRTPGGKALLHNKEIEAESGEFVFVPNAEISDQPIRANKRTTETSTRIPNRTVTEQSTFRQKVEGRAMREQGRGAGEIPLSETAIQPEDQRRINKITGVKSKIPREQRGTAAHHIFPVERIPGLRNNPSQGVMLTRKEHSEIHRLNPNAGFRKIGQLQTRLAAIKPLVRKKKKGRAIKKVAPKVAMVRTARHMSASELAAKFRSMTASNPDILKQNGTFDPLEGKIIDASTPEGAIRLQNIFESHGGKIGLNSITDTRQNIVTDMDLIESQLLEIEQAGGIPAIGVFDGSLEATNVLVDKTDDEIIANLGEAQRSTAIIDPDTKLRIVDNPRFKQN